MVLARIAGIGFNTVPGKFYFDCYWIDNAVPGSHSSNNIVYVDVVDINKPNKITAQILDSISTSSGVPISDIVLTGL